MMKWAEPWIGVTVPVFGNVVVAIESISVRIGVRFVTIAAVEILIGNTRL